MIERQQQPTCSGEPTAPPGSPPRPVSPTVAARPTRFRGSRRSAWSARRRAARSSVSPPRSAMTAAALVDDGRDRGRRRPGPDWCCSPGRSGGRGPAGPRGRGGGRQPLAALAEGRHRHRPATGPAAVSSAAGSDIRALGPQRPVAAAGDRAGRCACCSSSVCCMFGPARTHRFSGLLALLVASAVAAGVLYRIAARRVEHRALGPRPVVRRRRRRAGAPGRAEGDADPSAHHPAVAPTRAAVSREQ